MTWNTLHILKTNYQIIIIIHHCFVLQTEFNRHAECAKLVYYHWQTAAKRVRTTRRLKCWNANLWERLNPAAFLQQCNAWNCDFSLKCRVCCCSGTISRSIEVTYGNIRDWPIYNQHNMTTAAQTEHNQPRFNCLWQTGCAKARLRFGLSTTPASGSDHACLHPYSTVPLFHITSPPLIVNNIKAPSVWKTHKLIIKYLQASRATSAHNAPGFGDVNYYIDANSSCGLHRRPRISW